MTRKDIKSNNAKLNPGSVLTRKSGRAMAHCQVIMGDCVPGKLGRGIVSPPSKASQGGF
jgi:hypothetical protein